MNNLRCPRCGVSHIKKNGHTSYGKQNHRCLECGRQFVEHSQRIEEGERAMIRRLLLERVALLGICRVMDVSLRWLLDFVAELYAELPDDLNVRVPARRGRRVALRRLEAEADEVWSFVGSKANKRWVWIAIDVETRQVLAFHVGDRSRRSARALWSKVPEPWRASATFATDDWEAYKGVIPHGQHGVWAKGDGKTNIIERFNCTLRQRVSRLVRESLSFSKRLKNHIGAIKYFLCHYNEHLAASITFS
jgi:IS1 family transposase